MALTLQEYKINKVKSDYSLQEDYIYKKVGNELVRYKLYKVVQELISNYSEYIVTVNSGDSIFLKHAVATGITNWGDGISNNEGSHTYYNSGTYIIKTSQSGLLRQNSENIRLIISKFDETITNMGNLYSYCTYIYGELPDFPPNVVNISDAFNFDINISGGIKIPDSVQIMDRAFVGCSGLNGSISNLPSKLQSGRDAFSGCTGLIGEFPKFNEEYINENSSNITFDFQKMYANCTHLTGNITIPSSMRISLFDSRIEKIVYNTNVTSITVHSSWDIYSDSEISNHLAGKPNVPIIRIN